MRLAAPRFTDGHTDWQSLGARSGALDGSWGGSNDDTGQSGTEGTFEFLYGHAHDQKDYAISYTQDVADSPDEHGVNGLIVFDTDPGTDGDQPAFDTVRFNEPDDDSTKTTHLQVRHTCRVYDGDPADGGAVIGVPDEAVGAVPVEVTNEPAEGHTSGDMDGDAA